MADTGRARLRAVLTFGLALALASCTTTGPSLAPAPTATPEAAPAVRRAPTPTAAPSPSPAPPANPSGVPAAACDAPTRTEVQDATSGFVICLPASWRDLRAGDDGWVTIAGSHGSGTEEAVASGDIAHFVVPLVPRDKDTAVNLTIYTRDNSADPVTLDQAGLEYANVVRRIGGTDVATSQVPMSSGAWIQVTGAFPRTPDPGEDWLDAFVFVTPTWRYYLVFRCLLDSKPTYDQAFESYVETFTP